MNINIRKTIAEYFKQRTLGTLFLTALVNGLNQSSLELARLSAQNKLNRKLKKKYNYIFDVKHTPIHRIKENLSNDVIWIAWDEGMDSAPQVVQKCYKSAQKNLKGKKIIVITKENMNDFIIFPEYINKKYKEGLISKTHFSDLLRVELLSTYGGTWVDSTVFFSDSIFPEAFFTSELFFFQNLKPGKNGDAVALSSWFIHAEPEHQVILNTREMLFDYWKKNNRLVDYFLLHQFLSISLNFYERNGTLIPRYSNSQPHVFQLEWKNTYDIERYNLILSSSPIHKLTYKNIPSLTNSLYEHWIKENLNE